jgi:hypothetical protein
MKIFNPAVKNFLKNSLAWHGSCPLIIPTAIPFKGDICPGGGESATVDFCEYESLPEGGFVRVRAADHSLGAAAEYAH